METSPDRIALRNLKYGILGGILLIALTEVTGFKCNRPDYYSEQPVATETDSTQYYTSKLEIKINQN
jgi:hypothetical protein